MSGVITLNIMLLLDYLSLFCCTLIFLFCLYCYYRMIYVPITSQYVREVLREERRLDELQLLREKYNYGWCGAEDIQKINNSVEIINKMIK